MEEKRTCSNCGARLRPGARFCSACGAINRAATKQEVVEQEVKTAPQEPTQKPNRVPRQSEYKSAQQEVYYYEKTAKKSKEQKRQVPKEPRPVKETFSFDLAGDKFHLWNGLTAATSVMLLALGIVLLCVNFMSVTYEGYNISLLMSDCFDVLFNRDVPIFYEVTTEIAGMCSLTAIAALLYIIIAAANVGYNAVMYGRYDKLVLLVNTICSGVLAVVAMLEVIFYIVMRNKCDAIAGVSNYSTFAILLMILTVLVLILDVLKLTILYQKKVAALDRPSYVLDFVSKLGKQIWKLISIIAGSLAGVALIVLVILATAKSPAIKVWENYVKAYNAENTVAVSECYYPVSSKENANIQNIYKELFAADGQATLTKGQATLELRTEKYITIKVEGATIKQSGQPATKINTLKLHFGKVDNKWYLMSKVELDNGGNKVSINEFNQEVSSTILKINDTTVRGFSLKVSSKEAKQITELVIPNGITKIEAGAFEGLENLKTLVLPNTVVEVEDGAFKGCTSLETVKLGNKVSVLGESAFEGCSSLQEVVLPESLNKVGANAFKDCTNLTIYAHYNVQPADYNAEWNPNNCKVYLLSQWGQDDENPERINLLTIIANNGEYKLVDEDEYYENGEVANLPVPNKLGCVFLGWYTTADFDETTKLTSNTVSMDGDVTVYAKWEENVYNIEYDLDGGTLANKVDKYTVADKVALGMPEKPGYTFVGWLGTDLGETPVENVVIENATGHRKYTAVFKANIYKVTLKANGGTGSVVIEVTFGTNVKLINDGKISYSGMNLVGWNTEADGSGKTYKPNQEIKYTEVGDLTLYAMWTSLITLNPGNNATVEGDVPRIVKGQSSYKLPVPTTKEYLFFLGWYAGKQQITNEEGVGLSKWEFDETITLTAKWEDTMTKDGVQYYYRGVYPQSRVTDDKIITALTKITKTDARGYYEYNGEFYAKVKFNDASAIVYFNDGTRALYGNTYYFKVERILWRVVDEEEKVVLSEYVLDAIPFYDNNQTREYDDAKAGITVPINPNDFNESSINKFLNDAKVNRYSLEAELPVVDYENKGFLSATFGSSSKADSAAAAAKALEYLKYQVSIDNSESSTLVDGNPFTTIDTAGYFYPLSHKEYKQTYSEALAGSKAYATDYAIAREVECERTDTKTAKAATWWLRSPFAKSSKEAYYVDTTGAVGHEVVTNKKIGLRPACVLDIKEEEAK